MPYLPDGRYMSMHDLREIEKREEQQLMEWERNRIVKRCRICKQAYSYDKGEKDPKECQRCRGDEGDLIF
jgi:hypothetical protein